MGDTTRGLDPLGAAVVTTLPVLRSIAPPHRRRWVRRAVALALVVVALGWVYDGRTRVVDRDGAAVFLQGRSYDCWTSCAEDAAAAGRTGTLSLIGGRCLGLGAGTDGEVVLAWPTGSRVIVVDGRPAVSSGGRTYVLGEEIGVQTIEHESQATRGSRDWQAGPVPRACDDTELVEVVNNDP